MQGKKVLNVPKVGFYGNTGDNRAPESFTFPACMSSLMQYLGEDYPIIDLDENNQKYKLRTANVEFVAATGIAFGILWSKEFCMSCMDLSQVNDHNITIQHAYDWAGYEYEIIEKSEDNKEVIKKRIMESINNDTPVLAFGIIGPPECLIINGYDNDGDVVIGWSHFQQFENCETESDGMFRKENWYDNLWKIVLTKKRIGRKLTVGDVLSNGLSIMKKNESSEYVTGIAAYDEWIKYVMNPEIENLDDDTLNSTHELHHMLIGNHAEARCWGGKYLLKIAEELNDDNIKNAAQCFLDIHDMCWKIWGVLGQFGQADVWKNFRSIENRKKIAEYLNDIKLLDTKAMDYLSLVFK